MATKSLEPLEPYTYASAEDLILRLRKRWLPPEALRLSEWAERHIELPEELRARPGKYRNWPYMREILDAIGDVDYERVTVMKSARIGYTVGLVAAIGAVAITDPSQILLLLPTDEDAAEIAVDTVEPIFDATPELKGIMRRDRSGRNNTRNRMFLGGGSMKIRSGSAPRKLRRIDVQYLFVDEADGIKITSEGDAISLAEKRTLAKQRRKMVKGSTPVEEDLSVVYRDFLAGDGRTWQVPCPLQGCGQYSEIVWSDIKYTCDDTGSVIEDVYWQCPKCHGRVDERYKPSMVEAGKFVKARPHITDHASFSINALSSLLPQATWRKICQEWLVAKRGGLATIQVFTNTILGQPWKTSLSRIDADTLRQRAEPIGRANAMAEMRGLRGYVIPPEVLAITVGADVQDNRIEATVVGWTIDMAPLYLQHEVIEGNTLEPEVWAEFDRWHRGWQVTHPHGWSMRIDAMAVDSGGREGRTQVIYDWCAERIARGIYAIKGDDGPNRPAWKKAKKVKGAISLYIVGIDQLKTRVLDQAGRPPESVDADGVVLTNERGEPIRDRYACRFSDSLEESWFIQLTNEVRRITISLGRPKIEFKPKTQGAAVEALDCAVYASAVTHSAFFGRVDLKARANRRKTPVEAPTSPSAETPKAVAAPPPARKPRMSVAEMVAKLNKGPS